MVLDCLVTTPLNLCLITGELCESLMVHFFEISGIHDGADGLDMLRSCAMAGGRCGKSMQVSYLSE